MTAKPDAMDDFGIATDPGLQHYIAGRSRRAESPGMLIIRDAKREAYRILSEAHTEVGRIHEENSERIRVAKNEVKDLRISVAAQKNSLKRVQEQVASAERELKRVRDQARHVVDVQTREAGKQRLLEATLELYPRERKSA